MSRRRVSNMIRRFGSQWYIKPREVGGELRKINGKLSADNRTLSNADSVLSLGDLIHPVIDPLKLFIVTETFDQKWYEDYSVRKISVYGSLYRFLESAARDKFGKPISPEPTLVYPAVPLSLLPAAAASSDDTAVDRANIKTSYVFVTSDTYSVKINDRLEIGDMTLTITELLLSPTGILKFIAVA